MTIFIAKICIFFLDEKFFSLVVSETTNLLVYETTTLKWSAKLQFLPISIRRAFFKNVKGVLVFLSEEGRLECSYLGTEPNLFVAPPLIERELDLEKVEDELSNLNKMIKDTYGNDLKLTNKNADKEINIKINVDKNLEPCIFETNLKDVPNLQMCTVNIEVIPQMAFDEVQISLAVSKPLKVEPSTQFFINPDELMAVKCHVYLSDDMNVPSLFLNVVVTVISSLGVPRNFNKAAMLPLSLVAEVCPAHKEGDHKVTLNINQNMVPLLNLFPEFAEDTKSTSSIAFKSLSTNAQPVTILLAKSSERYRIQTSSFTSLSFVIEQLIHRLTKHHSNIDEFKMLFNSSLPSNEVIAYVKNHFTKRREVFELEDFLDQLSAQFRTIQKRLISKFKVKNPTPLTNLEILIKDTYTEILKTVLKLQEANGELFKAQTELTCALNLIGNLIKIMNIDDKLKEILLSVFCPSVEDLDSQNWEDVMDSTLCYLLRTYLAKSEKDKLRISQTNVEKVTDISKMEKHLVQVLERISKTENISLEQIEDGIEEEQPNPELEKEEVKPLGSQFGEASMRILSARRSLSRRRHKKDEQ
ncbi:unnamed protein product [Psylliodes chrysocephalus]|uniref:Protein PTHB1 n=1 Tax=Psylliodes chrysocephalus TaxID=3402493 RepID=A0A9P0G7F3_9CUCU|nr:unnamed protein product [Psylliodes chrysocephala]